MGKIFSTSTWRAPLQLIDCWLPLPAERLRPTGRLTAPGSVVRRFAQAGWLMREAANSPVKESGHIPPTAASTSTNCRGRLIRPSAAMRSAPHDSRLLISGSMTEVCAELDRLAALEKTSGARAA